MTHMGHGDRFSRLSLSLSLSLTKHPKTSVFNTDSVDGVSNRPFALGDK